MALLYVEAVLLDPIGAHIITNFKVSIFSRKLSPPTVNGCNLITSVIKSVLGCNGSCTLRGRGVHMPLIFCLLSCLSCFLVQKIQLTAPMYFKSHWVSGDVHDAVKRSHIHVVRSRVHSHTKPLFML